ncbi:transposase [candidate division KSB1 bacterium]|nr:transposase [candidate division KSB1 bacterium]RQW08926.1 MAG: transposase [candidate division KSB1 bacterium]
MTRKFKNKYRIESTRLQYWDYGWNAAYFVTICTCRRLFYFGDVRDGIMGLSTIGCLAWRFWYEIPHHFPFVILDAFIVMPNHVHGIIVINKPDGGMDENRYAAPTAVDRALPCLHTGDARNCQSIGHLRMRNPGKNTLSSIVGSYKSVVSTYAHKIDVNFAWQSRFHDRIIRDEKAYDNIANYIYDNPRRWDGDKFFGGCGAA